MQKENITMTNGFNEEITGIYRLKVPFEKIYTSVFLVLTDSKKIMVDCATTCDDVDKCIVPSLRALGFGLKDIDMIVLTHKHGDHAGGLDRILQIAPDIVVVKEIRRLCEGISTYALAGHTSDSIGVFDARTRTLISGDGIQGAGVDKYRCYAQDPIAYLETLNKIKNDEKIENILFSHAYEPWNTDFAFGRKNAEDCIMKSIKYVKG